jgi:hypothetical protein
LAPPPREQEREMCGTPAAGTDGRAGGEAAERARVCHRASLRFGRSRIVAERCPADEPLSNEAGDPSDPLAGAGLENLF